MAQVRLPDQLASLLIHTTVSMMKELGVKPCLRAVQQRPFCMITDVCDLSVPTSLNPKIQA